MIGGGGRKESEFVASLTLMSSHQHLHLLPNLYSCQEPLGFFFIKTCICAFILYPDHNALCQAALCGQWF